MVAGDAVLPEHCQRLIKVVPQKETDSLDLQWPIPPEQGLYRSRPCSYLSHLLGCASLVLLTTCDHITSSMLASSCNNLTRYGCKEFLSSQWPYQLFLLILFYLHCRHHWLR